jgi:hypothetical protein
VRAAKVRLSLRSRRARRASDPASQTILSGQRADDGRLAREDLDRVGRQTKIGPIADVGLHDRRVDPAARGKPSLARRGAGARCK